MSEILIPTIKSKEVLSPLLSEIAGTAHNPKTIVSGFMVSAATNRNYCLYKAEKGNIVIMMDDDITGLYPDWDLDLIQPLIDNPEVVLVSARLMNPDGTPGVMVGGNYDTEPDTIVMKGDQLPTACIAFRNNGTLFDENFIGSGFEDNDFCLQLAKNSPKGSKFVINNKCKVVHENEMKNQKGTYWEKNLAYFNRKWKGVERA